MVSRQINFIGNNKIYGILSMIGLGYIDGVVVRPNDTL